MARILLCFILIGFSNLFAQEKYNSESPLVSNEELFSSTFSNDPTANAFYIYENGFSRFENKGDYNILSDYSAKIKILNPEGYKHADVEISLRKSKNGKEKLRNLVAATHYLENGIKKVQKLDPSLVYTEENENYDLVKFTFPAMAPGAILVYSYQKESPFIFNFNSWWFQAGIPKLYSAYETSIPGNYEYSIKKVGELELDVHTNFVKKACFRPKGSSAAGDCLMANYAMKNIPAFIEEPYLTSRYNYVSRIEYELLELTNLDGSVKNFTKSWKDVDRELNEDKNIGRQLRRTSLAKNVLPEDLQNKKNDLAKAMEIYDYVRENYTWNGEYSIYKDMNLKDVIRDKTGSISSLNILLHNIYKEQDFDVLPVMSSTRSNGTPSKLYPVLSEFNYLMIQLEIEGKTYLLDVTDKYVNFGDVPFRGLNHYARLLDFKKGSSWIDIEPGKLSGIVLIDTIKVNVDGTSSGFSEHVFKGYHAVNTRNALDRMPHDQIFNKISTPSSFVTNNNTLIKNREEAKEPIHIKYELVNNSQKINDAIYFNPFNFKFFESNPFQRPSRNYPIDFGYVDTYSYLVHIEIPENHTVVELPEQFIHRLPENGGVLQFSTNQNGERNVSVMCRVSFNKSIYSSDYYPYLKDLFEKIIEIQSQSFIVMRENI